VSSLRTALAPVRRQMEKRIGRDVLEAIEEAGSNAAVR
jgi:hypothetical protein